MHYEPGTVVWIIRNGEPVERTIRSATLVLPPGKATYSFCTGEDYWRGDIYATREEANRAILDELNNELLDIQERIKNFVQGAGL